MPTENPKVAKQAKRPPENIYESRRHNIAGVRKEFRTIPVEQLRPGSFQSRRSFSQKPLRELSASLQATGINFTPLIVRPTTSGDGFEIICGERRWRAAQLIGMPALLCCVGAFNAEQALYMSGAENIQRENLNALEEAIAYESLINSGMTHAQVADDIGKSRSHISNYLRLLALPLQVRDLLEQDRLSFAQARPLCSLTAPGLQTSIAKEAVAKRWTAKQIERAVADLQEKRKKAASPIQSEDCNIQRLREVVAEQTGYPCVIVRTEGGRWQLGLSAGSVEEFEGILQRLGVKTDEL